MTKIKVQLKNGATLEGTAKEVLAILKELGKPELAEGSRFYYSRSKDEMLLISDMATPHLKNAIVARHKEWLDNLRLSTLTPMQFVKMVIDGPMADPEILNLLAELRTRK